MTLKLQGSDIEVTAKEDNAWWYCMGLMMGLVFTPLAETVWWKVGAFVLIAWAILRRDKDGKEG